MRRTSLYAVNNGIKWLCICGCLRPILLSAQNAELKINMLTNKEEELWEGESEGKFKGGMKSEDSKESIPAFLTNWLFSTSRFNIYNY